MNIRLALYVSASALLFSTLPSQLHAQSPSALLAQGHVDELILQLSPAKDAAAHNLLCRAYLSEDHFDEAVHECEAATAAAPANSGYQRWLGEAYGGKAGHTGKMSAFSLAKKASAAWSKAIQLDPKNADALSDLGEFCVDAPGIVGGGIDKARSVAQKLSALNPSRGHRLLARIAEKQNNLPLAEKEYTAAATGSRTAVGFENLAEYYSRHGSKAQVLSAVKSAVAADASRDYSIADSAGVLLGAGLDAKFAQELYRSYLDGPSRSDDAPACRVYTELGRSLAATGDDAGAKKEFSAALALAKNYAPAQKAAAGK
jgi:tetratricopeptide (TPR) repeat protein